MKGDLCEECLCGSLDEQGKCVVCEYGPEVEATELQQVRSELDALRKQRDEAVRALKEYADLNNWMDSDSLIGLGEAEQSTADRDLWVPNENGPGIAQQALARIESLSKDTNGEEAVRS